MSAQWAVFVVSVSSGEQCFPETENDLDLNTWGQSKNSSPARGNFYSDPKYFSDPKFENQATARWPGNTKRSAARGYGLMR